MIAPSRRQESAGLDEQELVRAQLFAGLHPDSRLGSVGQVPASSPDLQFEGAAELTVAVVELGQNCLSLVER